MNSLIHAFKEIEQGKIDIYVKKIDDNMELIYKDNGVGIKKENLRKIFDPFFTTNRKDGGSGLGLNIVYNIVQNVFKGTIEAKSTINKGLAFTIKFPLKETT
jgi:signal transduction histidine kinase